MASRARALAEARAFLATASDQGEPHVVPVTFTEVSRGLVIGIDEKPKSTLDLKRLRNIHENARVAVLWDAYDADWSRLWWVRADGVATIEEQGPRWEEAWSCVEREVPPVRGPAARWSSHHYRGNSMERLGTWLTRLQVSWSLPVSPTGGRANQRRAVVAAYVGL